MKLATIFLYSACGLAQAQGSIQKCTDADGKVHYQDRPCEVQQKVVGTVKRDTTTPDELALIRAKQERVKLEMMQIEREQRWVAEQMRQAKIEAAESAARARQESEARADARNQALVDALRQPYDVPYVTGPSVVRERVIERQVPAAPAPAPRPPTYTGPAASAPKK